MSALKFSIVSVTRNAADHLQPCLQSVANQSYPDVEHVIVDGASTDATKDVVARYKARESQFISEPDGGIYDAMNKGVRLARGDYILFLGADDYLVDDRVLADAAAYLAAENLPDLVYGDLEVRQKGKPKQVYRPAEPAEALDLMICGCLPHQATFARKTLFFDRVGLFDTRYRIQSDYDWFLRALGAEGIEIRHFNRVISSFFTGGASSRLEISQAETYAIQNAFEIYRRPEWVERRLHAFQKQLLAARIALQIREAPVSSRAVGAIKKIGRRAANRLLSKGIAVK